MTNKRCSFCGKKYKKYFTKMVQSSVDPTAMICKSCTLWFQECLDKERKTEMMDRPDESQRGN